VLIRSLVIVAILSSLSGCATKTEIIYSRATRASEETHGHLRLAENTVRVNVTGTNDVGEFTLAPAGGYYLIFEADLQQFVRNTIALQEALTEIERLRAEN